MLHQMHRASLALLGVHFTKVPRAAAARRDIRRVSSGGVASPPNDERSQRERHLTRAARRARADALVAFALEIGNALHLIILDTTRGGAQECPKHRNVAELGKSMDQLTTREVLKLFALWEFGDEAIKVDLGHAPQHSHDVSCNHVH